MKSLVSHLGALCACLSAVSVTAADLAFKFDSPADFKPWKIASQQLLPLAPAKDYAVSSASSLLFATPKWIKGMPEWPSCEAKPLIKDWKPYDRIVFDITNPNPERQSLSVFISDSKIPFRKGWHTTCSVSGKSTQRFICKLNTFPKTVDVSDISIVHLFTQRPDANMQLYVGSIMLLKPGEQAPDYPPAFVKQVLTLYRDSIDSARNVAEEEIKKLEALCDLPELKTSLANAKRQIHLRLTNAEKIFSESKQLSPDQLLDVRRRLDVLPTLFKRLPSEISFYRDFLKAGFNFDHMLVGTASSMTKLLPREAPFALDVVRDLKLSLARHEWESLQIAVLSPDSDLTDVTVTVSPLVNDKGEKLAGVNVDTVGYVKTTTNPPYTVKHVGWWPDPILPKCQKITVKQHDLQSFWLRFHASDKQAAGHYKGTVTVKAKGCKPIALPLDILVRNFSVPAQTALPTAITCDLRPKQLSQKIPFEKMKLKYADFLADYQIDFDNLYRQEGPDWEIIQRLHKQGRLVAFNLGNVFNGGVDEKGFEEKMQACIKRLQPAYDKAKQLGLLEYAYIYGFDERGKDQFPILERCAAALKKAFPEVILMTTSYDDSFGADTVVKSIDAWCPLTPKFDIPKADKARKAGKYVWWYICCGPHNPFTNWFVEYDAIESRLLMGAQTVKYRPDGFLYYCTSIWNNNMGIDIAKGPFTNWNPVSWTTYHGDGSLYHCDSEGNPLPSIRLENYRDGQEDYAYACILEEAIRQIKAKGKLTPAQQKWLVQAEQALKVPEDLVKSMSVYSRDPKRLRAWRDQMADAIEASGLTDLNPWAKGVYGVRAWRH